MGRSQSWSSRRCPGRTKESIAALAFSKEAGATVITLTGSPDSPLARAADFNFSNEAADDTSSESYYLQSLIIVLAIMRARGEFADYQQVLADLQRLPEMLLDVKRTAEESADQIAARIAAADYHIFSGAGSVWPQAYYYGMCILEEMQWIRTRPGARGRLLPRHPRTGGGRREHVPAQGRGRDPAAGRPGGGVRPPAHR